MDVRQGEGDRRIGPFTVLGTLPQLSDHDLSGGAFGCVFSARADDGTEAVLKLCRPHGGSVGNTVGVGFHRPAVGYERGDDGGPARHVTLGLDAVAAVLRSDAVLLQREGGVLLPAFRGIFEYAPSASSGPLPALAMEHVRGRRPETADDVVRVLESLAAAAESGRLDFHGDLKPEHVFLDDARLAVRLVDPAPRLMGDARAFTPEYNPYGLTGPASDVFALAVILYEVIARVSPFVFEGRPDAPFAGSAPRGDGVEALALPPPVARGRPRPTGRAGPPCDSMTTFVDEILATDPREHPAWASNHRSALQRLLGT